MTYDGDDPLPPDELAQLSDEEREFRASLEKLVDWVRVKQSSVLARAFLPAVVLVPIGGSLSAAAMSGRPFAREHGLLVLLAGVLIIASGPLWALTSLIRAMGRDAYVAIRVNGLGVRLDPTRDERVLAWDDILDVGYDEPRKAVCVELSSGEIVVLRGPFERWTQRELAQRIRDARRLAVWNRLTKASTLG